MSKSDLKVFGIVVGSIAALTLAYLLGYDKAKEENKKVVQIQFVVNIPEFDISYTNAPYKLEVK